MRKFKFNYVDSKGKTTRDRVAVVIAPPSDCYMCIDVTEYEPEDREYYLKEIEEAHAVFLQNIADIGLSSNWRRFKESGIFNVEEVE